MKKKITLLFYLILLCSTAWSKAEIDNIKVTRVGAGAIITYDLLGKMDEGDEIVLVATIKNKQSNNIEETIFIDYRDMDGDFGRVIQGGKGKEIFWHGIEDSYYYTGNHTIDFFVFNNKKFGMGEIDPRGEEFELVLTVGHSLQDNTDKRKSKRRKNNDKMPTFFKQLGEIFDGSLVDALSGSNTWRPFGNTGNATTIPVKLYPDETLETDAIRRKFYFDHPKRDRSSTYKDWESLWNSSKKSKYGIQPAEKSGAWHFITDSIIKRYYDTDNNLDLFFFKIPYGDLRVKDPPEYLLSLIGTLDENGNLSGHWETYAYSPKGSEIKESLGGKSLKWSKNDYGKERNDMNKLKCVYPKIGKKKGQHVRDTKTIQYGSFQLKLNNEFINGIKLDLINLEPVAKNKYPSLFLPKDEFETNNEYTLRKEEQKEIIYKVIIEITEEENQKRLNQIRLAEEDANKKEIEIQNKIAMSLEEVEFEIQELNTYDAETNSYPFIVNNTQYTVNMPRSEARDFKKNYESIKVMAFKQLRKLDTDEQEHAIKCESLESFSAKIIDSKLKCTYHSNQSSCRRGSSNCIGKVLITINIDGQNLELYTSEKIRGNYYSYLTSDDSGYIKGFKMIVPTSKAKSYKYFDLKLHSNRYNNGRYWGYYSIDLSESQYSHKIISGLSKGDMQNQCDGFYTHLKLVDSELTYNYFNFYFEHPTTGNIFPFGLQLSADGINTATISTNQKIIPPELSMKVIWIEPNGNRFLDAEEEGTIKISMSNNGAGSAFGVKIKLKNESENNQIQFDDFKLLGEIPSGENKTVEFKIRATEDVKRIENIFIIKPEEDQGFAPDKQKITFETLPYEPPNLVLHEHAINNVNDEPIIEPSVGANLVVLVGNQGYGDAENVKFTVIYPEGVHSNGRTEYEFKRLKPNDSKELNFNFLPSNTIKDQEEIEIKIAVIEKKNNKYFTINLAVLNKLKAIEELVILGEEQKIEIKQVSSLTIDIEKDIPKTNRDGSNDLAVILGIEEYQLAPNVSYAKRDAKFMKKYFENVLGIPSNRIYYKDGNDGKYGNHVSKSDFDIILGNESNKGWLAQKLKETTNIYFYYAGHGIPGISDGKAYLLPSDGNPDFIAIGGFPVSSLYDKLDKLNAKSTTVFLDACFAGESRDEESLYVGARPVFVAENEEVSSKGINIFSASGANEISSAWPEKKHGLFSYYLMKGMKGEADLDKNKEITFKELGEYLRENVSETAGMLDRSQNPSFNSENPDDIIIKY